MFHNSRTLLHCLMNLSGSGFTRLCWRLLHWAQAQDHVPRDGLHRGIRTADRPAQRSNTPNWWCSGVNASGHPEEQLKHADHEGQAVVSRPLKEKGTRVISIDPSTTDQLLANAEWIAPERLHRRGRCWGGPHPL